MNRLSYQGVQITDGKKEKYYITIVLCSWSDPSHVSSRFDVFWLLLAVKPVLMSVPKFSFWQLGSRSEDHPFLWYFSSILWWSSYSRDGCFHKMVSTPLPETVISVSLQQLCIEEYFSLVSLSPFIWWSTWSNSWIGLAIIVDFFFGNFEWRFSILPCKFVPSMKLWESLPWILFYASCSKLWRFVA
jgi:hypothetical protein